MILPYPLLWITVILPVLLGIIAWPLRSRSGLHALFYLSAASLIIPLLIIVYGYASGALETGSLVDPLYFNLTRYSVGTIALGIDGLSAPVIIGLSIVTSFVAIYSIKYMETRISEMEESGERPPSLGTYLLLYNIFAATMLGLAYSTNLVEFYVFLEGSLISSFLLIAFYGYGDRRRISLLYFVWTHIGAVVFLTGVLYLGYLTHSFDYLTLLNGQLVSVGSVEYIGSAATLIAALLLFGLFVKMAVFGVHMWLPYAHAEAPTPISALLSPNLIGLAGYAIARFVIPLFPTQMESWRDFLLGLAFTTIIYAGLVSLRQTDFKRFLAYSSISQMGYMLLGLATLNEYGIMGAMLIYLSHAIGKALLFMSAGVFITEAHGLRDITKMGGLARRYPLVAALALFGFMNLAGLPPSIGMWSEIFVVLGVVKSLLFINLATMFGLSLLLIVALTITAAYSFITMRRVFYGQPRSKVEARERVDGFKLAMLAVAVFGVVFFLAINPLTTGLSAAISHVVLLSGFGGGP
ncbi:NADH-quinone oxidoreductase subunit M [Acidilobus saccharovorans 345-15]|uniref:NADH-quinone oxidoreductase subunit M n=1 Tax=Acidilobus saccharovorans (strain DSM 16705 / JCM 18335 / VKM B-2471 / 345-15) TaxID=666510 RepID=D9Q0E4_ACIS3|nr:complex I subunit 5 family protein [Acidilobus saccharovorans]ADL18782.1 NADH-quinone oxidoreductase subunit M [Acidilobus saccharovorans 345-15]